MKILVATDAEYTLAKTYLKGFDIVQTGVGPNGVVSALCKLPDLKEDVINVGFCGSNRHPVGSVLRVKRTYSGGYVQPGDKTDGKLLSDRGELCYTSDHFIYSSDSRVPVLYDMELQYIAASTLNLLGAVKIVSDNLSMGEYEENVKIPDEKIWEKVNVLVYQILKEKGQK